VGKKGQRKRGGAKTGGSSWDAMVLVVEASLGHWCGACCYQLSRYHGQEERREESHPFYLRAGGACFLYIHCQALPAPSHSCFRRCAASRLPSGPGLLPSGLGCAVPVRCCFGMLLSSNVPSWANMHLHDTYPMHPYRLRVTTPHRQLPHQAHWKKKLHWNKALR